MIPGLAQWVKDLALPGSGIAVSCGVGHRRSSDSMLLWLWCRLAVIALIRPLAWEAPYAMGAALTRKGKRHIFLAELEFDGELDRWVEFDCTERTRGHLRL